LLSELGTGTGSLLENDDLLNALERIQRESDELNQKTQETTAIISELDRISGKYHTAADKISMLYDVLRSLRELDNRYIISDSRVLAIIFSAIRSFSVNTSIEVMPIRHVVSRVFSWARRYISRSLLQKHRIIFDIMLILAFDGLSLVNMNFAALSEFRKDVRGYKSDEIIDSVKLNDVISQALSKSSLNTQQSLSTILADQTVEIDSSAKNIGKESKEIYEILQTIILSPQKLAESVEKCISHLFTADYAFSDDSIIDQIIHGSDCKTPFLMRQASGHDSTILLKDAASQRNYSLLVIDLGVKEAETLAEELIMKAMNNGSWILLENVHLTIDWVDLMVRKLSISSPSENFRLLFTTGISNELPGDLVYSCRTTMIEITSNIAASLRYFILQTMTLKFIENPPVEAKRAHFLIVYLHCLLLGRLLYVPIGWSSSYEFTEADLICALRFTYYTLSQASCNQESGTLSCNPYQTICDFLCDIIYGSKLVDRLDRRILQSLASTLFKPNLIELQNVSEASDKDYGVPVLPKLFELQDLLEWSETSVFNNNDPKLLGLSSTMNDRMLLLQGRNFHLDFQFFFNVVRVFR
jgi:dynein heavy chain 1, cytosolic